MCLVPKQKKRCLEDALTCSEGSGEEKQGESKAEEEQGITWGSKGGAQHCQCPVLRHSD